MTALEPGGRCDNVLPAQETVLSTSRQCATLADILRWRATHQRDRLAYRFLLDGESREVSLTHGDLDQRARAIAAALTSLGAAGERALLVYPPGLDFICAWFGCAYAAAVAVVVHPPHPARVQPFLSRVAGIAHDARPAVALTTSAILDGLPAAALTGDLRAARWLATDGELEEPASEWPNRVTGEDLAFLQYTSGSTTEPKGVMVTHGNLMHNLCAIQDSFCQSSDKGYVSWLPPYHDMGLIGGILAPLCAGSPVTLMPPAAFVQRPRRWLWAITRFKGAVSGGPNFAYDLCVRKITPEQRAGLDLSSWRVAFNGAEPVNATTMREFAEHFAPCGFAAEAFTPCYGLAESTLLVSANTAAAPPRIQALRQSNLERHQVVPCAGEAGDARALVSCGRPAATVALVDPEALRRCPPGQVGEIWVSGPSVARGYWQQPAETERTFHARLPGEDGTFLRTGDLGFMLDGELFVTGRLKDLIIVDGNNHYPQDIEQTAGHSHQALESSDCAAFAVEVDGTEALVLVAAVRSAPGRDGEGIKRAIRTAVSEQHALRVHDVMLVRTGSIPRTASGKIRRGACRASYLARTLAAWGTT